jgi:hypothetical protein
VLGEVREVVCEVVCECVDVAGAGRGEASWQAMKDCLARWYW